jgi:hypothetical protein
MTRSKEGLDDFGRDAFKQTQNLESRAKSALYCPHPRLLRGLSRN